MAPDSAMAHGTAVGLCFCLYVGFSFMFLGRSRLERSYPNNTDASARVARRARPCRMGCAVALPWGLAAGHATNLPALRVATSRRAAGRAGWPVTPVLASS